MIQNENLDLSLSYLLSFIDGDKPIEFNKQTINNVNFKTLNSTRNITLINEEQAQIDFTWYMSSVPPSVSLVEEAYLLLRLPAQKLTPERGDGFAWADVPGIKMINRIEIYLNQSELYDIITGPTLLSRLQLDMNKNNEWKEYVKIFLGGELNPLSYSNLPEIPVVVPLPIGLFPLHVKKFNNTMDFSIYFKIILNMPHMFSNHTALYVPATYFAKSKPPECRMAFKEILTIEPPVNPTANNILPELLPMNMSNKNQQQFAPSTIAPVRKSQPFRKPVLVSNELVYNMSLRPRNEQFELVRQAYVNRMIINIANPTISSKVFSANKYFFGNVSYNALENFINAHVLPPNHVDVTNSSNLGILNLSSGLVFNLSSQYTVQLVSSNMYIITYKKTNAKISFISVSLDWSAWPEDIQFLLSEFFEQDTVPVHMIKTIFFYSKNKLYERVTLLTQIEDTQNGRLGFLEGLFTSIVSPISFCGAGNIEFHDNITSTDMHLIRISLAVPVSTRLLNLTSKFSFRKFIKFQDPNYIFADLDRNLKFGAIKLVVENLHNSTGAATRIRPEEWYDTALANRNRWQRKHDINPDAPPNIFEFGDNFSYLDTQTTRYIASFQIGLYDRETNQPIVTSSDLEEISIRSVLLKMSESFTIIFISWLVKMAEYDKDKNIIQIYTTNTSLLQEIYDTYYRTTASRKFTTEVNFVPKYKKRRS